MTTYHTTKLNDVDGSHLSPTNINDKGVIVGSYRDSHARGFLEDTHTGVITDIDPDSELDTIPNDINNDGQVVGLEFSYPRGWQGFVYDTATGVRTDVDIENSRLQAINDAGLAVGSYVDRNAVTHGFVDDTRTGTITTLDIPGGTNVIPLDLDEAGDVAGDYTDASGHHNGFVRHPDGAVDVVHVPGSSKTFVDTINDEGQIAGTYHQGTTDHLFVEDLATKTFTTLDVPDAIGIGVRNITDTGVVLGVFSTFETGNQGLIYDTKTSALSAFNVPGAESTSPEHMNDKGQIVGTFEGNSDYGFVADPTTDPPCYCPGTMIETASGERPVEVLAIGDMLETASGRHRPVKWVGYTRYHSRQVEGNPDLLPVCIKAGALGWHVPRRDLWVSPGHALLVDDNLVHARLLTNGVSIVQPDAAKALTYVHVELDRHDIIIAEGAKAESFLDNGCRKSFSNAADFWRRYPDATPGLPCMPLLEEGFGLEAIRRRIDQLAGLAPTDGQEPGRLRGFVEGITSSAIRGWAQDESRPEEPVCLEVLVDGSPVLSLVANRRRGDLVKAGLGRGRLAFEASFPRAAKGRIEVRRSTDRACLALTAKARVEASALL